MNNTSTTSSSSKPSSSSKQALWFLVVGASAALVHFLVLVGIVNITATRPALANIFAFLVAFIVSFMGHFYLTFRHSIPDTITSNTSQDKADTSYRAKTNTLQTLLKWFASSAAGFIVNQGLFVLGLNWLGERYYILIWLVVTAIITVMTFALGKLWAFKS